MVCLLLLMIQDKSAHVLPVLKRASQVRHPFPKGSKDPNNGVIGPKGLKPYYFAPWTFRVPAEPQTLQASPYRRRHIPPNGFAGGAKLRVGAQTNPPKPEILSSGFHVVFHYPNIIPIKPHTPL